MLVPGLLLQTYFERQAVSVLVGLLRSMTVVLRATSLFYPSL
jgi:hypothetical protein